MIRAKKILSALFFTVLIFGIAVSLSACRNAEEKSEINSVRDLDGKRIGIITGSVHDELVREKFDNPNVMYFDSAADVCAALYNGVIDALTSEVPAITPIIKTEYESFRILGELATTPYAYMFRKDNEKGSKLCEQMNEFLAGIKASGELDEIGQIWFGDDEDKKTVDYSNVKNGENGVLRFATSTNGVGVPFTYIKSGEYVGYDVDIAVRFCEKYGYGIEITDYNFSGLIAAVQSGKDDFAGACITITDERKEQVLFSETNYESAIVFVINEAAQKKTLDGKRFGILTGSVYDIAAKENFENPQLFYTESESDLCIMLERDKVDAIITDEPIGRYMQIEYPDFEVYSTLSSNDNAFIFNKDDENGASLCAQMNEFLAEIKANGVMKNIDDIWFGDDESIKTVDYSNVSDNGKQNLVLATSSVVGAPFTYYKDGAFVGYDIDIAVRFCEKYGYSLEIQDYSFSGLLAAVQSGKADFGAACIIVTDERKENFLFSEPNYSGGMVVMVKKNENSFKLDDLSGEKIAVMTGTIFDTIAQSTIENPELFYCDGASELCMALDSSKVKAFITDEPIARCMLADYDNFKIAKNIEDDNYAFTFNKESDRGLKLCAQMNDFLEELKNDGTLAKIDSVWFGNDESLKTIDFSKVSEKGENGTVVFATSSTGGGPFAYMKNGTIVGYEMDIAVRFCEKYGYQLQTDDYSFSGLIAAVQSGKADMAAACITITEERREKVLFSDTDYEGGVVIVVNENEELKTESENPVEKFINTQIDNFSSTFIREERWKLFLEGIGKTMLITVLSIVLGIVFGVTLYVISYTAGKGFDKVVSAVSRVIQGMPVVVLLMILFYIVFVKTKLSGEMISIVGFTLIFTSSVYGMLKIGAGAVNKVQTEASLALGFTKFKTFTRVIFPQALRHIIPMLKSEVVAHIKATAVVGYIAVQDLTKMSDIIRSRTYEAFFPLIVTALIYFALEFILTAIVKSIQINTDPKRRSKEKILKGIKF